MTNTIRNNVEYQLRDWGMRLACAAMAWTDSLVTIEGEGEDAVCAHDLRSRFGCWLYRVASSLFSLCYTGSEDELTDAWENPPRWLNERQWAHIGGREAWAHDPCLCLECGWRGGLHETAEDYGCPDCNHSVVFDRDTDPPPHSLITNPARMLPGPVAAGWTGGEGDDDDDDIKSCVPA